MHRDHKIFIQAIKDRIKIRLTFFNEEGLFHAKVAIPMDYNPGRRGNDKSNSYHFWALEQDNNSAALILHQKQIISMRLDKETFDPSGFVTRKLKKNTWFLERDWD
ncbi:MAG: hypothetical protein ACYS0I_05295 [Planctomycetota bacterium]|jgi:hypothetical protein